MGPREPTLWSSHSTLERALAARRWQRDGNLLWRVRFEPERREPWLLVHYYYVASQEAGMPERPKLNPGPTRDLLGLLSAATRGGEALSVHQLTARTGVPYSVMRDRAERAVDAGLAERREFGGESRYTITDKGREML